MMKYSRTDEAQADAVGAIILYKAGYNPHGAGPILPETGCARRKRSPVPERSPESGKSRSGDPEGNRRVAHKNFTTNSPAFQNAKQLATNVKAYDSQQIAAGAKSGQWAQQNQKSGAVLKNAPPPTSGQNANPGNGQITNVSLPQVQPSGNFKSLNLDSVKIQYPDNWQVMQDQQQSSVTIAPQAGVSGNAIAYGVVINGASPPNGQQMNIDQITSEVVKSIIQGNGNDTKQVGSPQPINVNGVSGRSVELLSTSPIQGSNGQPLRERDWVVTVPRGDGSAVFLVFVAPEPDFSHLRPTYESMLRSLRLLPVASSQ